MPGVYNYKLSEKTFALDYIKAQSQSWFLYSLIKGINIKINFLHFFFEQFVLRVRQVFHDQVSYRNDKIITNWEMQNKEK